MPLKFKGKTFDAQKMAQRNGSPAQDRLEKYLNTLPKDEIFLSEDIADSLKMSVNVIKSQMPRYHRFDPYMLVVSGRRFWGSPAAIKQLKKENNEN